jgi:hypothetical protein
LSFLRSASRASTMLSLPTWATARGGQCGGHAGGQQQAAARGAHEGVGQQRERRHRHGRGHCSAAATGPVRPRVIAGSRSRCGSGRPAAAPRPRRPATVVTAPPLPAHQPVAERRRDAAGGAEGFDQFTARQRLVHQRHARQRHALAGQRRLDLLVGEVQVDPAPRLQPGGRVQAQPVAPAQVFGAGALVVFLQQRLTGQVGGSPAARQRGPRSAGLTTGVRISSNSGSASAGTWSACARSAARSRSPGRRGRRSRRAPRRGCRPRGAGAGSPAAAE